MCAGFILLACSLLCYFVGLTRDYYRVSFACFFFHLSLVIVGVYHRHQVQFFVFNKIGGIGVISTYFHSSYAH